MAIVRGKIRHVFVANGITDGAKKRAVFLSVIGASNYKLLSSLVAPAKPGEKEYSALVDKLTEHFTPAPSEIVERYKFHTRFRKSGESVAAFVSELRSIAKFCNFGETLETMLRDRIVCGINDAVIQCRLLSEKDLTFKTTLELAQSMESAAKNLKELNDSSQLKPPATAGSTPMRMVLEPVLLLLLLLLLAAMTYNQVHYFRVNHLADFTQNGHTKTPVG